MSIRAIRTTFSCLRYFAILLILIGGVPFSWTALAKAEAEIPDLAWQPEPFVPTFGSSLRFIDFEQGSDRNPGTKSLPWKHHPWDPHATDLAKSGQGVDTYIFRKGVVYRGTLVADDSGLPARPIRLTVDPDWGSGEAVLSGSAGINTPWHRCNQKEATPIPASSRSSTWCTEWTGRDEPRLLWEIRNGVIERIPIARSPNWNIINPNDPRSQWPEISGVIKELRFSVETTRGFSVGDRIWLSTKDRAGSRSSSSSSASGKIARIGTNYLLVDLNHWNLKTLKVGAVLTNSNASTMITALPDRVQQTPINVIAPDLFGQQSPENLRDATLWLEAGGQVRPRSGKVIASNPAEMSITVDIHWGPKNPEPYNRYFLEGLPQFLDTQGEYCYRKTSGDTGILYLRLAGDRDPNNSHIEAASRDNILILKDRRYVDISGLSLRFTNQVPVRSKEARHAPMFAAAVQIRGSSSDITIHHCHLQHLPTGIVTFPSEDGKNNILDNINITDNDFDNIDGSAVVMGSGRDRLAYSKLDARLIHAKVLRNRLRMIGYRPLARLGAGAYGDGIDVDGGELVEIAGNHVDRVWGSGISLTLGSDYERSPVIRPLLRGLVHHNKITNSILGTQDTGGIGTWMGGPTYIYDNISGNPVGYKHAEDRSEKKRDWYRGSSYGIGIYLDGQYKSYVFNNIIWGKNNNIIDSIYNSVAINEAMGFLNTIFHNTIYRFAVGLHKGMFQHNRSYYIGNLMLDIGSRFIQHEALDNSVDYQTLAYSHNVLAGTPSEFGQLGKGKLIICHTIKDWRTNFAKRGAIASETGIITTTPVVQNAAVLDFRPRPGSAAIDAGAKVFVPWGLSRVVGEWNFLQSRQRPEIVNGENLNMNQEWVHRSMFLDIPRNDLRCTNINANSYVQGFLENWARGAVRLNGSNQYCAIKDDDLKKGYTWKTDRSAKHSGALTGAITPRTRDTVDIGDDNFLIEAVLAPDKGHSGGGIASKLKQRGYALTIDEDGAVELALDFGNSTCSRTSSILVNDGQWHHVIAEVDRESPEGINLYIDGILANGRWNGHMDPSMSLSNTDNFTVGRSGNSFFSGNIDFLRIAKGTLAQSETTIGELYNWEFNGPFLKDFSGKPPYGLGRDAGAVEYYPN